MATFEIELKNDELQDINGGGLLGAVVGYAAGVVVGGIAGVAVGIGCVATGESASMTGKAVLTVFAGGVICGTAIGACATGII